MPNNDERNPLTSQQLIEEIRTISKRGFFEAVEEWDHKNYSLEKSEKIIAIRTMKEINVFIWLPIINTLLKDLIDESEFTTLCLEVAEKLRGDLAAEPFWQGIMAIGRNTPVQAKEQVDKFLASSEESGAILAANLLVGIAGNDDRWFRFKMEELFVSAVEKYRFTFFWGAYLELIRLQSKSDWIVELILSSEFPSSDILQTIYAESLSMVLRFRPDRVGNRCLLAIMKGNHRVKSIILKEATSNQSFSLQELKTMVTALINSNKDFKDRSLIDALIRVYREDRDFVLGYFHRIMKNQFLFTHFGSDYYDLLHEIGLIDSDKSFQTIDRWLDEDNAYILYEAADILQQIFFSNPIELIKRIHAWNAPDTLRFFTRLEILKNLISERINTVDANQRAIIDVCVDEVCKIMEFSKVKADSSDSGTTSKVFQALITIDYFQHPIRDIDYNQLILNLDKIPHVRDFMGKDWFERMKEQKAKGNLLLHLFDNRYPSDEELMNGENNDRLRSIRNAFSYWEDIFSRCDLKIPKMRDCRKDLIQYDRTEDTLCELELFSLLRRKWFVNLRQEVKGLRGPYDLGVHLSEQNLIIEVYNPQPERILMFASGVHGLDTQRIKKKILEKFEKKFNSELEEFKCPYIFAINSTSALIHISEFHIDDIFNSDKSIVKLNPSTIAISGILLYRREMTGQDGAKVISNYYGNPNAMNLLTAESVSELISALR